MAKKKPTKKKDKKLTKKEQEALLAKAIEEDFGGDAKLLEFYMVWMEEGKNATEAYHKLNPDTKRRSAAVLGSRMVDRLTDVNMRLVLQAYGLGRDVYFEKLKEGLNAHDVSFIKVPGKTDKDPVKIKRRKRPNFKDRREYHEVLGKMHGLESDKDTPQAPITVNVDNKISDWKKNIEK